MSVPLGDRSQKKFNWASELSTIFRNKPIVVFGSGLFAWNHDVSRSPESVQTASFCQRVDGRTFRQVVDSLRLAVVQMGFG
jgi:hypothetical protein